MLPPRSDSATGRTPTAVRLGSNSAWAPACAGATNWVRPAVP